MKKLYKIEINLEDTDETGIELISIVERPAIGIKGVTFAEIDPEGCPAPPCHPNCYSSDTSVMTKNGLKLIKNVKEGEEVLSLNPDTKVPEWVKCIRTFEAYGEKAVYIHNNNTKMLVSETHPFFGYQRQDWGKNGENRKVLPKKVYSYKDLSGDFKFYKSSEWVGKDVKSVNINGLEIDIISYLKLMGYYLSEGSTTKTRSGKGKLQSSVAQEKYIDIFREDLSRIDIKWWYGKTQTLTTDDRLTKYLNKFGKSYEKYVPELIKTLSPELIDIFLDSYCLGDGSHNKGKLWKGYQFNDSRSYYTSSLRMRDDLMELIIKNNKSVSIKKTSNKGDECFDGKYRLNNDVWTINELRNEYSAVANMKCEIVDYNDWFYDIEVEKNNTLFIEYKGTTHWGSNCKCDIVNGQWKLEAKGISESGPCEYCIANKKRFNRNVNRPGGSRFTAFKDNEKMILAAPTMVPDLVIDRIDEYGEYQVVFSKEVIEKIVQKFFRTASNRSINLEHTKSMVPGYILQHWIVEDTYKDKSNLYGFELPVGSHFMMVKIEDKKFWDEQVKANNKNAFSIEGILGHKLIRMKEEIIKADEYNEEEFIDSLSLEEMRIILGISNE